MMKSTKYYYYNFYRSDELKRQYIGVLCGLGSDPSTGESIYHEHDMELAFDTHITNEDIAIVSLVM